MDSSVMFRIGWKILAVLTIPLIVLVIILTVNTVETDSNKSHTNSELNVQITSNLWPAATVPFAMEPYMEDAKLLIKNAMKVFENRTCVKFVERKTSEEHWLNFVRDDDICMDAALGVQPSKGPIQITFGLDCLTIPIIQKALGRVLGLEYEETRPDRDGYISFDSECREERSNTNQSFSNISQFHNQAAVDIYFDYLSHMFRETKCIRPKGSEKIQIGSSQNSESGTFSVLDIEKLNAIYNCPGCNSYRFRPANKLTDSVHSFESFHPVHAGKDLDGVPLYICRVLHIGSVLIGKLKVTSREDLCWVTDNGQEYRYGRKYEILINPNNANFTWIPQGNSVIPPNAVRGGRTSEGKVVYIGRCVLKQDGKTTVIPSSAFQGTQGLKVPFGHIAHHCSNYEILICTE